MMSRHRSTPLLLAALALAAAPAANAASQDLRAAELRPGLAAPTQPIVIAMAMKKAKRYGIEGKLVSYDDVKKTVTVKVAKTKVSGSFGSGGVAGDKAPSSIKRGADVEFAVVPEGSVLKRTVFKAQSGGGLDNSGTEEGFKKAFDMVPKDRPVVISFEKNPDGAAGAPEFQIKLVQIRMTQEELERRFEEMSEEVE